ASRGVDRQRIRQHHRQRNIQKRDPPGLTSHQRLLDTMAGMLKGKTSPDDREPRSREEVAVAEVPRKVLVDSGQPARARRDREGSSRYPRRGEPARGMEFRETRLRHRDDFAANDIRNVVEADRARPHTRLRWIVHEETPVVSNVVQLFLFSRTAVAEVAYAEF